MSRTFNTHQREKWNAPIHHILKAIDNHTRLWMETGDYWHEEQAIILRQYLRELKIWIHLQEKNDRDN